MIEYNISQATMEKLLAVARTLTTHRDLNGVLHDLLQSSLDLISGADFACVFLYDQRENALVPVGGVGFDFNVMKNVRLQPGESITGKAFIQRKAILLPTSDAIRQAQSNLTPEHDKLVRQAVGRPTNPVRSSIAAPLMIGEETVGVLVVDNYDTDRNFDERDLAVVTALADHAAVAVANAQEHSRRLALSQELKRTLQIQKQLLASLVTQSDGLTGLTKTLSRLIKRSIDIYDWKHRLVARVGEPCIDRITYPIQAGSQRLGQLEVCGRTIVGLQRVAIDQALLLYAIELLRTQALERERQHFQVDLFHRILEGDQTSSNVLATQYGLVNQSWNFVLLGSPRPEGLQDNLIDEWTEWLNRMGIPYSSMGKTILLVLPERYEQAFRDRILLKQDSSVEQVISVWSDSKHHVSELSDAFRAVIRVWRFLRRYPFWVPSQWVKVRDFPEIAVWEAVPKPQRDAFVEQVIGPIIHDEILLRTLRTWIFSNRSFSLASSLLKTHPNTIRYRIDKISHLIARSFMDDRDVMLVRMALIWHDMPEIVTAPLL